MCNTPSNLKSLGTFLKVACFNSLPFKIVLWGDKAFLFHFIADKETRAQRDCLSC